MKVYSGQIEKLEIALVKSKQDLGEAMNAVYEYETENKRMKERLDSKTLFQIEPNNKKNKKVKKQKTTK